jgi:thymidylate synthase
MEKTFTWESEYLDLLGNILMNGENRDDRTGVGTRSVFGESLRINLEHGFPAVTTKKLAWKAMVGELLWFLEGSSDERRLAELTHGKRDGIATIWTPNALAPYWKPKAAFEGDLGRVYGKQWRDWTTAELIHHDDFLQGDGNTTTYFGATVKMKKTDQVTNLIEGLKTNPNDRRHIITAWNPGEWDRAALPACHAMCQFYLSNDKKLSCQMYQRSVDTFLGLPLNIASYALLTHMVAQCIGAKVGTLTLVFGDAHIYNNHVDVVKKQLDRKTYSCPKLKIGNDTTDITKFTPADFSLGGYVCHDQLKAEMAV